MQFLPNLLPLVVTVGGLIFITPKTHAENVLTNHLPADVISTLSIVSLAADPQRVTQSLLRRVRRGEKGENSGLSPSLFSDDVSHALRLSLSSTSPFVEVSRLLDGDCSLSLHVASDSVPVGDLWSLDPSSSPPPAISEDAYSSYFSCLRTVRIYREILLGVMIAWTQEDGERDRGGISAPTALALFRTMDLMLWFLTALWNAKEDASVDAAFSFLSLRDKQRPQPLHFAELLFERLPSNRIFLELFQTFSFPWTPTGCDNEIRPTGSLCKVAVSLHEHRQYAILQHLASSWKESMDLSRSMLSSSPSDTSSFSSFLQVETFLDFLLGLSASSLNVVESATARFSAFLQTCSGPLFLAEGGETDRKILLTLYDIPQGNLSVLFCLRPPKLIPFFFLFRSLTSCECLVLPDANLEYLQRERRRSPLGPLASSILILRKVGSGEFTTRSCP